MAGGSGQRFGAPVPKQFLLLQHKPVLYYSIKAFLEAFSDVEIVLVLPPAYLDQGHSLLQYFPAGIRMTLVMGGETRFHSVQNALAAIKETSIVFVHDGVRPLVSASLIRCCYEQALQKGTAIPAIEVKDSIRELTLEGSKAVDRSKLRSIQTPQTFHSDILLPAFQQPYLPSFTDEATVVELWGQAVTLIEGEACNIKITRPLDLVIAEKLLQENNSFPY